MLCYILIKKMEIVIEFSEIKMKNIILCISVTYRNSFIVRVENIRRDKIINTRAATITIFSI